MTLKTNIVTSSSPHASWRLTSRENGPLSRSARTATIIRDGDKSVYQSILSRVLLWQPREEAGEGAATEEPARVARYPLTPSLTGFPRGRRSEVGKLFPRRSSKRHEFMRREWREFRIPKLSHQNHESRTKNSRSAGKSHSLLVHVFGKLF